MERLARDRMIGFTIIVPMLALAGGALAQTRDVALGAVTLSVPAEWRHTCTRPVEGFELHALHHPNSRRLPSG